jgi:hypothetical protein
MAQADLSVAQRAFGTTARRDAWWAQPLVVFAVLSAFIIYATWAAFQGEHYHWGPYLSPFYSPLLFGEPDGWFGPPPAWWPGVIPFSAALLILWAPGGFRLTCYYYRGAYYKAFWADPPSCAVGEPRKSYLGERSFPLILQNGHRFFLWVALVFLPILAHDVWKALWFVDAVTGQTSFGIGLGTVVLAVNTTLLGAYALGCHSLRHVVGGQFDEVSRLPPCLVAYRGVSRLNRRHMTWAWLSLFSVAFADLYVRMLSMGVWSDPRLL